MDEAQINAIARKFADLMNADQASPSANVPTEMARISGAIREAITALETQLTAANQAVKVLKAEVAIRRSGMTSCGGGYAALDEKSKAAYRQAIVSAMRDVNADPLANPNTRSSK